MATPTIDPCSDGRCARDHYGAADWEALGHEGFAYGTPSPEILAVAQARGATVVAYDGDGMWAFYRPASASPDSTTQPVVQARGRATWRIAAVLLSFSLLVVVPWWMGPAVQRGVGIVVALSGMGAALVMSALMWCGAPIAQVLRVCRWMAGLMGLDIGVRLIWAGQWLPLGVLAVVAIGVLILRRPRQSIARRATPGEERHP